MNGAIAGLAGITPPGHIDCRARLCWACCWASPGAVSDEALLHIDDALDVSSVHG